MEGFAFLAFACCGLAGFMLVASPIVFFVNHQIGKPFLARGEEIDRQLATRQVAFAEDDVPLRLAGHVYIGASIQWMRANVRVADGVLYLFPYRVQFGKKFGRPNLAIALRPGASGLMPLKDFPILEPPARDGEHVRLTTALRPAGRWTLRFTPRDPDALLRALTS